MKIKFQLIESKQDSNGLCPVFLQYFYSGRDLRYFTGEKCMPSDWDSEKMKFKRSHERWQHANERMSKLRSDLESAIHDFKLQKVIPTLLGNLKILTLHKHLKKKMKLLKLFMMIFSNGVKNLLQSIIWD